MFVALHGSWNAIPPTGYKITFATIKGDKVEKYEDFATGFLNKEGRANTRPVDILQLPDGSLLVSDDHGGKIYRITYSGTK